MIACLPMYDFPFAASAHDALWVGIRDRLRSDGIDAPDALDRNAPPMDSWAHPDLLLGQICNLPLRAQFEGTHARLGCADHGLPDVPGGYYRSVIIVRKEHADMPLPEALQMPLAYNEALSQSGWGALWALAQSLNVSLSPKLRTGAHAKSVRAVASEQADIAAIDAVSWQHLRRDMPETQNLTVIGHTTTSPGMTFVTTYHQDQAKIRAALRGAIQDLSPDHKETLCLFGLIELPPEAYALPLPPSP